MAVREGAAREDSNFPVFVKFPFKNILKTYFKVLCPCASAYASVFLCLCECACTHAYGGKKYQLPQELELEVIESPLTWVLKMEPGSSVKAVLCS